MFTLVQLATQKIGGFFANLLCSILGRWKALLHSWYRLPAWR
jgi:hypothetical protein